MKNKLLFVIFLGFFIQSCAHSPLNDSVSEWDFDHHVRFEQHKLADHQYFIRVLRFDNTHFGQLATFLLRQAYKICQGYGFTLEVLDGIETVDDRKARPNWIPPSLTANIECLAK